MSHITRVAAECFRTLVYCLDGLLPAVLPALVITARLFFANRQP